MAKVGTRTIRGLRGRAHPSRINQSARLFQPIQDREQLRIVQSRRVKRVQRLPQNLSRFIERNQLRTIRRCLQKRFHASIMPQIERMC